MKTPWLVPLLFSIGCGSGAAPPVSQGPDRIPSFLALHTTVIARTCSPNPGVCHQANNYPDLRTPGSMLAMIGMPCNLEIPDPTQGADGCEARADRLLAFRPGETEGTPFFSSDLAWKKKLGAGRWKVGLRQAPAATATTALPELRSAHDVLLAADDAAGISVDLVAGVAEATLTATVAGEDDFTEDLDLIFDATSVGDPNQNGIFGFEAPGVEKRVLIAPGSLANSYLWGRITGTVPGSRMPLANRPLSDPEYVALACWIEGLDPLAPARPSDPIDYDRCDFAANPISYAIGSP